jgi:carbamoyltransferase
MNPRFHDLLEVFYKHTECPLLINTSFNVRGEPIVCSPEDALACFAHTDIDALVLENCLLEKADQPAAFSATIEKPHYELD